MQSTPWHARTVADIVRHFGTDATQGISSIDAEARRSRYGANTIEKKRTGGIITRFIHQLRSPIALVLIAAGVAALLLGKGIDASVIAAALLVNICIGVLQEGRASRAFEKLIEQEERTAFVLREGRRIEVPIEALVPGDVVILEAGGNVPADIRLTYAVDLTTNESALTGEWVAIPKETGEVSERTPLASQSNMVFRGTTVVSGQARGIVVRTGEETEVGQIAEELSVDIQSKTPLEQNMEKVARFLLLLVLLFAGIITLLGVLRGEAVVDIVLVSIAVAVAAIPEGLPAAVTASLALGMERILRHGGLVRNLLAAETLGTTTIILTDKTGTLTKGHMKLVEYAMLGVRTKEVDAAHVEELLTASVFASDAAIEEKQEGEDTHIQVHGRPIERAIVEAGLEVGITIGKLSTHERLAFVPFSSERRYGGAVVRSERDAETFLYVSGAPEVLLARSSEVYDAGMTRMLTPQDERMFTHYLNEYAGNGLRVIAVAQKNVGGVAADTIRETPDNFSEDLTFLGLLVFADSVREEVPGALAQIREAGARVVMVTGDNPNTALYVAKEVGICGEGAKVFTGSDIDRMSDRELVAAVRNHFVFARVLPKQKLRLARALRNEGEVVAMTGDGINDAPALQAATIGVAVGSGTDVAKEASDLVLLDNSFSIIVRAIEEGRRLRDNIKKIVAFLLSTNFSGTFIVVGSLLLALPLPVLPTQILWANIVGGGLMNFAFAFEPKDPATLARGPRDPEITNILSKNVARLIITVGVISGSILLAVFFYLTSVGVPIEEVRTIMFVALSMDAIFFAFSMKSFTRPIWRMNLFSNPYLIIALIVSLVVLLAALTIPGLQFLLTTIPLSAADLGILALLAIGNVLIIEVAKAIFFRKKMKVVH